MIDPERWRAIELFLDDALEIADVEARAEWLRALCDILPVVTTTF